MTGMDPTIFGAAVVSVLAAVTLAVVTVINALAKAKLEILDKTRLIAEAAAADNKEILKKVDGNYSDLKKEVTDAKAEVVTANQRIAVLVERLITSTPATAVPPPVTVQVNGTVPHP